MYYIGAPVTVQALPVPPPRHQSLLRSSLTKEKPLPPPPIPKPRLQKVQPPPIAQRLQPPPIPQQLQHPPIPQRLQPPPIPPNTQSPSTSLPPPLPKPRARNKQTTIEQAPPLPQHTPRHHNVQASPLEEHHDATLSLEYITLREMLADLVDLLAGNAPVITQLNNHLFSSDLIPEAVHIGVDTTGLTPTERANKIFSSVLATLKSHPNPNIVFTSLITAIHSVGLTTIAIKLMDRFSKYMHH